MVHLPEGVDTQAEILLFAAMADFQYHPAVPSQTDPDSALDLASAMINMDGVCVSLLVLLACATERPR